MSLTAHLSKDQRIVLAELLQSQMAGLERDRASQLHRLTQAALARETLMQDADDTRQRAGEHEVEGIVADIDSSEFDEIRDALQRIHGASYGLCADCHAAIPFDRLRREPQALRCVTCKARHERNPLPQP